MDGQGRVGLSAADAKTVPKNQSKRRATQSALDETTLSKLGRKAKALRQGRHDNSDLLQRTIGSKIPTEMSHGLPQNSIQTPTKCTQKLISPRCTKPREILPQTAPTIRETAALDSPIAVQLTVTHGHLLRCPHDLLQNTSDLASGAQEHASDCANCCSIG
jgi:hypothetical protein